MSLKDRIKKLVAAAKALVPHQSRFVPPAPNQGPKRIPGWREARYLTVLHDIRSELAADLTWVERRHASFVHNVARGNVNSPIVIQARDGNLVTISDETALHIINDLREQINAIDVVIDGVAHGSGLQRAANLAEARQQGLNIQTILLGAV